MYRSHWQERRALHQILAGKNLNSNGMLKVGSARKTTHRQPVPGENHSQERCRTQCSYPKQPSVEPGDSARRPAATGLPERSDLEWRAAPSAPVGPASVREIPRKRTVAMAWNPTRAAPTRAAPTRAAPTRAAPTRAAPTAARRTGHRVERSHFAAHSGPAVQKPPDLYPRPRPERRRPRPAFAGRPTTGAAPAKPWAHCRGAPLQKKSPPWKCSPNALRRPMAQAQERQQSR